MIMLSCYYY